MGKLRFLLLLVISCLLCGCSKEEGGYILLKQDLVSDVKTSIVYKEGYTYKFNESTGELSDKQVYLSKDVHPCLYLIPSDSYTLSYIRPITYSGDYKSFCGYISYLLEKNYKYESYTFDSEYADIILYSDLFRIRVIWCGKDEIKILCENTGKNGCSPPYISGKEEGY